MFSSSSSLLSLDLGESQGGGAEGPAERVLEDIRLGVPAAWPGVGDAVGRRLVLKFCLVASWLIELVVES
jgi:hypothetical protein